MEKEDISLQHKVDNFLFVYRNSVHDNKPNTCNAVHEHTPEILHWPYKT